MSLKFSTSELKTSLKKAFRDFEKKDSIGAQLANELHVKLFLTSPRGKAKKPSSKKAKEEEPVEEKKAKKAKDEEPVEEKKKTKKPSKKASKEEPADEKPRAKKTSEKPVEEKTKGKKNEKVIEFNEEHQQWMDENGFVFNKDSKTVIGIIKEGVISRLLPEDIEFAKTLRYRVQEGEESQEEEKKEEEPSQAGAQPQEDEDDDGKDIQTQMEEELAAISDLDISREQFELYNSLKDKFSSDSEIANEMKVKPNVVRFIADNYASLLEKFPAATAKKTLKKKTK